MNIPIITSAPIRYQIGDHDLYDSFDLVSRGEMTASLQENASSIVRDYQFDFPVEKIQTIFIAEKGQTLDTAKLLIETGRSPRAAIISLPELNGIRFSMQNLIPKDAFARLSHDQAMRTAREQFIIQLFNNRLTESLASVKARMKSLIEMLRERENALCISHGFYVKLLQVYVGSPHAFTELEALQKAFEPDERPYQPLQGFTLTNTTEIRA
ncbi:MAG: phosphoglycerate mutase family protein [bacterium]